MAKRVLADGQWYTQHSLQKQDNCFLSDSQIIPSQHVFGGRANLSLTSQILKLYHCYLAVILAFSNRQENIMICILSSWQMKEKQDRSNALNDQLNSYGSEVTLLSLGLSFIWPWISDQVEAPLPSMLVHRTAVKQISNCQKRPQIPMSHYSQRFKSKTCNCISFD